MGATDLQGIEASGVHKILCLLDALRHSQTGAVIYRQVERMLEDVQRTQQTVAHAYVTLINQLLNAYLGHLREGSPSQVQIRLLQARLQPPLTASDLETLRDYVERYAGQIEALKQLDTALFQNAVEPLLAAFGIGDGVPDLSAVEAFAGAPEHEIPAAGVLQDAEQLEPGFEPETGFEHEPEPEPETMTGFEYEPEPEPETEPGFEPEPEAFAGTVARSARAVAALDGEWPCPEESMEGADSGELTMPAKKGTGTPITSDAANAAYNSGHTESKVDTAYRSHLDSKRRDIQKLQSTLAQQVLGTIAQNEEFGVLLEVVLGELRQAGDGKELEDLRWTLIREIEKLTKGHHELAERLDCTHHYLQLIESDSRQLSDELTRVRLLSLTDELTGLPNRRAFLRRIEDEVARVQRYGFPLSLVLIDLDHFKQVNDRYGHAGGDEVLQMYSKNILSIFRHHDLVARYGGEEFAVLLPNTDADGSTRALTKVKGRAAETRWQANGGLIPVPTFSAGVSLYKPGETASTFIERADKALYRAKRLGRNRVEMDATYFHEAGTEAQVKAPENGSERQHVDS